MPKVVFDTNVYISAFLTKGGKAEAAYFLALQGKIKLYTSVSILTETAIKLRTKFLWNDEAIKSSIKHISRIAKVVKPVAKLNILSDEPDNRILECSSHVKADYIVTGDKHILGLKKFEDAKIVALAEFMNYMK